jgi:hypothetical protein
MASETELQDEKLDLEIAKLRREGTLTGRLLPSSTAIAAIAGIVISIYTLIQQGTQQTNDAKTKSLQQALSMATNSQGQSDRRISGIYQLASFWADPADELVVATTLAALVVLPDPKDGDASSVRCAAAAAIGTALELTPSNKTTKPQRESIARLLYGTAGEGHSFGSLGLLTRQNNILRRKQHWDPIPEDSSDKTIGCETQLAATREAIRKGYAYLGSANFSDNDLSYTRLYAADLHGAELSGAQLVGTNLRCANLIAANMNVDTKINKFEDDKDDAAMTDTRLANVDKASLAKFGEHNPFAHTITLSSDDWHTWEKDQFTISTLRQLLGTSVHVNGYPEDFCVNKNAHITDNKNLVP